MDGHDAGPGVGLHMPVGGAQLRVIGEAGRPQDVQHRLRHPQPGGLPQIRCLGAFVGDVGPAVAHPVVPQVQQPHDFRLDVNIQQPVAHFRVSGHRAAPALGAAAMLEQPVDQPVAPDAPAGAVLQLQMGGGDFPALIFAADEVESGNAHLIEKDGVLDAGAGPGFAAGDEQIHRLDGEAGQIGRHHKPAQVFVPLGLRVGYGNRPHIVGAVGAADIDFLAVQHEFVAVAEGRRLHIGQIGAGLRFGKQLPGTHLPGEDGRQEVAFLRRVAPDQDGVAAQPPAGVVVGRQGQAVGVDFLFDDHGVVDVEAAAAVFGRGGGPEPAALPQAAAQVAPPLVLLPGEVGRVGGMLQARRHVVGQPRLDLAAEFFLFRGVAGFEIHQFLRCASVRRLSQYRTTAAVPPRECRPMPVCISRAACRRLAGGAGEPSASAVVHGRKAAGA